MKTQLIMLEQPILVSDEEIKEKDWYYSSQGILQSDKSYFEDKRGLRTYHLMHELWSFACYKIIAGIPELPSIDFSALSEEDCKKIGWVDVEKLANKSIKSHYGNPNASIGSRERSYWETQVKGFIEGFKAAQSLNEKKFSEDDLRKAIRMARFNEDVSDSTQYCNSDDEIIQSLSQPKIFDVEVEMETIYSKFPKFDSEICKETHFVSVPKITNNSIKILKVL